MAIQLKSVSARARNRAAVQGFMKANPNMCILDFMRAILFTENGVLDSESAKASLTDCLAALENIDDDDTLTQIECLFEIRLNEIAGGVEADDRNARIMMDNLYAGILDSSEKLTRDKLFKIAAPGVSPDNLQAKTDFAAACKLLLEKHPNVRKYNKDGDPATVGKWAMLGIAEESTRVIAV